MNIPVGDIALGTAALSLADNPDEAAAIRTIHAGLDAGVRMIDTALAYTTTTDESHSESVIRRALNGRDDVLVATKGGHFRAGPRDFPVDGRPETLRRHCDISLQTLGVERIGLYYLHHPDPRVPIADSAGALRDLQTAGKIALIGLSNVDISQLDAARSVADIAAVQNHFSLFDDSDRPVLDHCTRHGIAYLAYSPLKGAGRAAMTGPGQPLPEIAERHRVSIPQVVLAWNLRQSERLGVIVGATREATIRDSVRARHLALTDTDIAALQAAIGPRG